MAAVTYIEQWLNFPNIVQLQLTDFLFQFAIPCNNRVLSFPASISQLSETIVRKYLR